MISIDQGAFAGSNLSESITFENHSSLKKIGEYAFKSSLLKEIEIPPNVTSIEKGAFCGCKLLEKITFKQPSSLITIGDNSFENCSSLTRVTLPSIVTSIGNDAFKGCSHESFEVLREEKSEQNQNNEGNEKSNCLIF